MRTLRAGNYHKEEGMWMSNVSSVKSAAREISEDLMREFGLDETDWKLRDRFIHALNPIIREILDEQMRRSQKPSG